MPPKKKKCPRQARKAELVFLERPRGGPVRAWESPLPPAKNPRLVPTKPADQSAATAWVCPQFGTSEPVSLEGCQKSHRAQNWDALHPGALHQGGASRKVTPCKFPPLTFETSEGPACHLSDHPDPSRRNARLPRRQPPKRAVAKANIPADSPEKGRELSSLPDAQPVEPEVSSSPEARAQTLPPGRSRSCSSTLPQMSGHAWLPRSTLALAVDPPGREDLTAVLVTDTPEHAYGLRVTWRQRPHILRYLRERG
ncbi:RHNO1 protein, partial [Nothoprocta pentlandii]|nr:RHNO1 protein [Nothoprocta pentlandii]